MNDMNVYSWNKQRVNPSIVLVYDRQTTLVNIIIGRYGIIKPNNVCNRTVDYFTNLTGIINNIVPTRKNDLSVVKISLVRDENV